jgi:hypothetical protein
MVCFFKGDYWVGEIEAVIENMESEEKVPWRPLPQKLTQGSLISKKKLAMTPRSMRSKDKGDFSAGAESSVRPPAGSP